MECSSFCWLWVLLVLLYSQMHSCVGCLEEERNALLEFKAFANVTDETDFILWDDKTNCCAWPQVRCNHTTGRVIELFLNRTIPFYDVVYLNATIFLPFVDLRLLDLSSNYFLGWPKNEGFERLHGLRKLQVLDISFNRFNTSVLSSLVGFSSLKSLFMVENQLHGLIPIQDWTPLSNLEILDMTESRLSGEVPLCIGTLPSLKILSLRGNNLNGSLNSEGFCQLKNVEELVLLKNEFGGSLPPCLSNFTSLRLLDLSENRLNGTIPSFVISSLKSLEFISLSHNRFEGSFSFSSIANHSKLEVFHLDGDTSKLQVETEYPHWVPTFQLKSLRLPNCNLNKPTGVAPSFLSYQYDLREVDLSHNNLTGSFPGFLNNNTRLEFLYLQNNSFIGSFHLPSHPNRHVFWLDVSDNRLHGHLPINIGTILPFLAYLNMSSNAFEDFIPSSIGEMRYLLSLDLSRNNFLGEIPKHMVVGCISLKTLKLSNNRLHGQLFPTYFNLTRLLYLYLDSNNFTGRISNRMPNSPFLSILEISNNSISGKLPSWIGKLSNLETLLISENNLDGTIPVEYCKLNEIQVLDLSRNNLSGSLPSCFNSSSLRYIYLQRNMFTGPISKALSMSSSLVTLDLRDNNFSGGIPTWINRISKLKVLLLKGNLLQGPIPIQLCQLDKISMLDLSNNSLSGAIPSCLKNLTFGRTVTDDAFVQERHGSTYYGELSTYSPTGVFVKSVDVVSRFTTWDEQVEVEFITKRRSNSYKGYILNLMSGMDLSWNQLTGNIPLEIGELSEIRALNLSHNRLTGSIPVTFSNLKKIESMDLSYNSLSGIIPSQLTELYYLAIFNVSYNNLSGRTPDHGQFANFDEKNYGGNPGLCGPRLKKSCKDIKAPQSPSIDKGEDDGVFDMVAFYWSFVVSYIVELLGFIAILCINANWRRAWFRFIDACISLCSNWF